MPRRRQDTPLVHECSVSRLPRRRCYNLLVYVLSFQTCCAYQSYWNFRRPRPRSLYFQLGVASTSTDAFPIVAESTVLGRIYRLGGDSDADSFVSAMGVPSFAAFDEDFSVDDASAAAPAYLLHRLDQLIGQGPALTVGNILTVAECQDMVRTFEYLGFTSYNAGKNHHGALQVVVPTTLVDRLSMRMAPFVDLDAVEYLRRELEAATNDRPLQQQQGPLRMVGWNRRWRVYKYTAGTDEHFAPHIDAGFAPSGLTEDGKDIVWDISNNTVVSRLTILLYLSDDFKGGETTFFQPRSTRRGQDSLHVLTSVRPVTGSCLVFPQAVGHKGVEYARQHWPLHEGSSVTSGGPKYVIRSDMLFVSLAHNEPA